MRHLVLSIILITSLCCIGNAKAVFSSKKTTNHTIIKNLCTTESAKKTNIFTQILYIKQRYLISDSNNTLHRKQ